MAKATKKQVLGRGLSALLKDTKEDIITAKDKNAEKLVGSIIEIEIDSIQVNPFQPRSYFNDKALQELADSIKELGVIQPITVRKLKGNSFQIVSGERRFRASKLIGNKTIPAYIRLANDQEMLEMALVENVQRENLDPIDIALSYQRMIDEIKLTQNEMAKRIGKSRSSITNFLRLLKLDPIIQTGMRDGFLTMGHGRALININDRVIQLDIYEKILTNKLSVRQTEQLVKNYKNPKTQKEKETPVYISKAIKNLSNFFGHKITIKTSGKNKGKIEIPFHSEEDFNRIKNLLK